MPVTEAAVQSSGISHPLHSLSLNYTSGAAVAAVAASISQPLNCEIPYPSAGGGGEADQPYHQSHLLHHHSSSDHLNLQQQSQSLHCFSYPAQQQNYSQSLLAVVGSKSSYSQSRDRMTTDLPEWDVETPAKGDISMLDNSHGMISPTADGIATATQITASTASSSSSTIDSPQQDLWWTEGLVMQAQQEYPGELGE